MSVKKKRQRPKLKHSTTTELQHANKRMKNEDDFHQAIEDGIAEALRCMRMEVRGAQEYHVLGVIEYMRRQKAIALVGSVASGKTTVLKLVSQTLKAAFNA